MVSVIIPTYNRAHLIGRAIRSVLDQSYQDFEVIVVDDGSTDNTAAVVMSVGEGHTRIRYIRQENRGGGAARNAGLRAARGKYVALLDSDDEWMPHKLETEVRVLKERAGCAICATGHVSVDQRTGRTITRPAFSEQMVSQMDVLRGACLTTNNFTAAKDALLGIGGFDETLPARQDWDLWIRITGLSKAVQLGLPTLKLHIWEGGQISSGLANKREGTIMLLNKHRALFSSDPSLLSGILSRIGLMYLLDGDMRARLYLQQAYACSPRRSARRRLSMMLCVIRVLGNRGIALLNRYYRLQNPDSYLLR